MSGKNNVNPDHYKLAGRDRPNEKLPEDPPPLKSVPSGKPRRKKGDGPEPNLIPGAPPVGEGPPDDAA